MSHGQQKFKQRDVTKALKATVNAGIEVGGIGGKWEGQLPKCDEPAP